MQMFPDAPGTMKSGDLTVVTLSERTLHDMTGWSPEVDHEREQLLENVRPL